MAIVKAKSLTRKRKLDEQTVSVSKQKKAKSVKQPKGKIVVQKPEKPKEKIVVQKPEKPKEKIVVQKPEKPKTVKKLKTNFISLRKYDPKIDTISSKFEVPIDLVETTLSNIIKLVEENPKVQNKLLEERFPIFLQLNVIKIPKCYPKVIRIKLEHSLLESDDEVCFIVPDLKQFKNKEYDNHFEHYEELFKQKGVTNIKKIMTMHQLKNEYENFELKRGLVDLYDKFLVDGRISGRVIHQLGKVFYKKRKVPIPVNMNSVNLALSVEAALKKTMFQVHSKGDSFMVQIGHNKMCERELVENVFTALQSLGRVFPGGLRNMSSVNVFARMGSSLPIYMSKANPNTVKRPRVPVRKPKLSKVVRGELSTRLNVEVKVKPTGEVVVKKK